MKKFNYKDIEPKILSFSQKGQDSLIEYTFDCIGTENKYYVELGAIDGFEKSNTCNLRLNHNWNGLLIEGNIKQKENKNINLFIRRISKDNICEILKEFNVPKNHDFMCIDLDGCDYWITKSILNEYRPRVIMVETNVRFEPDISMVLKYDENWNWDGSAWYGGSPYAFKKMLNNNDYIPVYIHIDDMIAIRKDVIEEKNYIEPTWEEVYQKSNIDLYNDHTRGGYFANKINIEQWEYV